MRKSMKREVVVGLLLVMTLSSLAEQAKPSQTEAVSVGERVKQYRQEAMAIRRKMAADPNRPLFHFLPPRGFLGDPNGLMQFRGQYHVFFQYRPDWPEGAPQAHWGHAVSDDLVHWHDMPIALAPTPGGPDKDGCYSGCATVDDDGTPVLVYTGVGPEVQCLARSFDGGVTWIKHEGNPVLAHKGLPHGSLGWRDPYVWKEGDGWRMTLSSGIPNIGGCVPLYEAPHLNGPWTYRSTMFVCREWLRDYPFFANFECVNFLRLEGEKWLMIVSAEHRQRAWYFIGSYDGRTFTPEVSEALDGNRGTHPKFFYAPQVFRDEKGRLIMIGWIQDGREGKDVGYNGVLSLPRVLSLRPDGRLNMEVAPELQALRGRHWEFTDLPVGEERCQALREVQGECLELLAKVDMGQAQSLIVTVRQDEEAKVELPIIISPYAPAREVLIRRDRASTIPGVHGGSSGLVFEREHKEDMRIHLFVDRSIVELFINGRAALTTCVYPGPKATGIDIQSRGGPAVVQKLDIWEMKPIWPVTPEAAVH